MQYSSGYIAMLLVSHSLFLSVEAASNGAGRNRADRTKSSQSVEPFGKCEYMDGKSTCPDFPEDDLLASDSDTLPGVNSESDDEEDLGKPEDPLNHPRQDSLSRGFYHPHNYRDIKVGWSGPHAEALAYARRPFDDMATYAVVDESPRPHSGYNQVPCDDCPGLHCDTYHNGQDFKAKWELRVQHMCEVKLGTESATMKRRIEKRRRGRCHPLNDCYGEIAKSSTVARCPSTSGRKVLRVGMTTTEKNGWLFYHNLVRAMRAEGTDFGSIISRNRQVANMMEMEWDPMLADQAQRLVNVCDFNYDCSLCSGRAFVPPVGQILVKLTTRDREYMKYLMLVFMRISPLSEGDYLSFNGSNVKGLTGQLLWAKTTRVGCGMVQSQVGDQVELLLACNYFPSGNRVGSPMVEEGTPCSRCPYGYACTKFSKVLCSRFFHNGAGRMQPEESEQFFAVTSEEKKLRARIVNLILSEAKRPLYA